MDTVNVVVPMDPEIWETVQVLAAQRRVLPEEWIRAQVARLAVCSPEGRERHLELHPVDWSVVYHFRPIGGLNPYGRHDRPL